MPAEHSRQLLNVRLHYGAKGNGIADDIDALEAAAADAVIVDPTYGGNRMWSRTILLPRGRYRITRTWELLKMRGLRLVMEPGAVIQWDGDPEGVVIRMEGAHNTIEGGEIEAENGASIGIEIKRVTPSAVWIVTRAYCKDIEFRGTFGRCISVNNFGAPSTQNSEYHLFERVKCSGYTEAGIHVFGSQVHVLGYRDCEFRDGTHDGIGIWSQYGSYCEVSDCRFFGNSRDMWFAAFITTIAVKNCVSRDANQFMLVGNQQAGSAMPVTVRSVDVRHGAHLNATEGAPHESIAVRSPGPLYLEGSYFEATNRNPMIRASGLSNGARGSWINGNVFRGPDDYFKAATVGYSTDSGNIFFRGPLSHVGGTSQMYAFAGPSLNYFWSPSLGRYERIDMPENQGIGSISTVDAKKYPKNIGGTEEIEDGGSQDIVVNINDEGDTNYTVFPSAVEITDGDTDTFPYVSYVTKSNDSFTMRLNAAPDGWSGRVDWMLVRGMEHE